VNPRWFRPDDEVSAGGAPVAVPWGGMTERPEQERAGQVAADGDTDAILALVEQRLDTAERDLADATGGAPLCRIDGSGPAGPKFAEGRTAALAELRRALRRSPGADAVQVVGESIATWDHHERAAAGQGPSWRAYRAGGATELRQLGDRLRAPDADR